MGIEVFQDVTKGTILLLTVVIMVREPLVRFRFVNMTKKSPNGMTYGTSNWIDSFGIMHGTRAYTVVFLQ